MVWIEIHRNFKQLSDTQPTIAQQFLTMRKNLPNPSLPGALAPSAFSSLPASNPAFH